MLCCVFLLNISSGKMVEVHSESAPKIGHNWQKCTYMPWHIGHAWSEFCSDLHAVFFVGKPMKFSSTLYQYDVMFAMDPRVVFAESRFLRFFFTKNWTKSVFVCVVLLPIWSYKLFLKAKHLRDTTNVNNDHSKEFKLVTDALLSTSKCRLF